MFIAHLHPVASPVYKTALTSETAMGKSKVNVLRWLRPIKDMITVSQGFSKMLVKTSYNIVTQDISSVCATATISSYCA